MAPVRSPRLIVPAIATVSLLALGCGGEPARTGGEAGAGDAAAGTADTDAGEAATSAEAPAGASGLVEVVVDGETLRFEHLPAEDNELNPLALEMHAQRSAEDEQGVFVLIQHTELADLDLPHLLDGFDQEELDAGETPYRMQISYQDAEGRLYGLQANEGGSTGVRITGLEGRHIQGEILPGRLVGSSFEPDGIPFDGGTFDVELARRR
ncbi:MAG: hypothetical protein PVI57_17470 [Gemmatimonadota bacterium]|jgi:hypothetical protein